MVAEIIATARRSSLVSTFGVGAIFPVEDDSVMICGIDEWRRGEIVSEPRLEELLGVQELRSPPSGRKGGDVPVVRFPTWGFCPDCRTLGQIWKIADRGNRRCSNCAERVSPSRFVACCPHGHIEDFPYWAWVHRGGAQEGDDHRMRLVALGRSSALSDLVVTCSCGREESLDGAFGPGALRGVKSCSGRRPWILGEEDEDCSETLRTLQRGSANVWFAVTRSAISIPSPQAIARRFAEDKWKRADSGRTPEDLATIFPPPRGCTTDDVAQAIRDMRTPAIGKTRLTEGELRAQEYQALINGIDTSGGEDQFTCEEMDLTGSGVSEIVAQVSRVSRLREVRALEGFSRLLPWTGDDEEPHEAEQPEASEGPRPPRVRLAPLGKGESRTWLPALEVLGEGVFVRIDEDHLSKWEESSFASARTRLLRVAQEASDAGSFAVALQVSARSLALHSLAHMLIDELSLSAGYAAASLRERVYDAKGQAGILVYTATADGAGSLGGLAAQSHGERMGSTIEKAVRRARWCTSDPICSESTGSGVGGMNLAACHACLLVPETSCERFNLVLDRASVVGLPGRETVGLFGREFL